ncbi:MAG TPA: hypothetical protein VJA16_08585 [Thermoanaerobaculia bacterium]
MMMMASALVIAVAPLFAGTHAPQLLVIDRAKETLCRDASSDWDSTVTPRKATASAVAEDIHRYFAGLSAQFTTFLEATWHGHLRFCTDAEEDAVLGALAVVVVRPPIHNSPATDEAGGLPSGAEGILKPLASQALIKQLLALQPANAAEHDRQRAALAVVRSAIASRQPRPAGGSGRRG